MRMARKNAAGRGWAMQLLERKRPKVVAVASMDGLPPSPMWGS